MTSTVDWPSARLIAAGRTGPSTEVRPRWSPNERWDADRDLHPAVGRRLRTAQPALEPSREVRAGGAARATRRRAAARAAASRGARTRDHAACAITAACHRPASSADAPAAAPRPARPPPGRGILGCAGCDCGRKRRMRPSLRRGVTELDANVGKPRGVRRNSVLGVRAPDAVQPEAGEPRAARTRAARPGRRRPTAGSWPAARRSRPARGTRRAAPAALSPSPKIVARFSMYSR